MSVQMAIKRLMERFQNPCISSAAAATVGGVYVYDEEWVAFRYCQGSSDVP